MTSKKPASSKRAVPPRASDYTKTLLKDRERLSRSGRYDLKRLKEAMLLLIGNDAAASLLGADRKHWFRAKFFQPYRLFFRYHAGAKLIVYAWINDDGTKRAYESSDDTYRVFRKMLESGHPPDDWDQLLSQAELAGHRLLQVFNLLSE